jgi:hypothetical protein
MMKANSQHGCSQTAYVMSMTVVPKFNLAEVGRRFLRAAEVRFGR